MPNVSLSVVTLGTAAGPVWWAAANGSVRAGISTAVVVDGHTYLVDAGSGVGHQMASAGLPLSTLAGVFITHLHSDHIVDLGSLLLYGIIAERPTNVVPIYGPGNRGKLPPTSPRWKTPPTALFPQSPTPGIQELFDGLLQAYANDLNIRHLDEMAPSPLDLFEPRTITIPGASSYDPNDDPFPTIEAFEVHRDERVVVTATLVRHPPVAPAFAFRFETAAGSVVISGDTAPCANIERISQGADLLLHEALDFEWVEETYGPVALRSDATQALIDHHHKSHTDPKDVVKLALRAGVKMLTLHHLGPSTHTREQWLRAARATETDLHVANDLDVIVFDAHKTPRLQPR